MPKLADHNESFPFTESSSEDSSSDSISVPHTSNEDFSPIQPDLSIRLTKTTGDKEPLSVDLAS